VTLQNARCNNKDKAKRWDLLKIQIFPHVSPFGLVKGKGKSKGRSFGLFQHCGRSAFCILTPNNFPHSSPEAPRNIQMRETSTSEGGNYYQ